MTYRRTRHSAALLLAALTLVVTACGSQNGTPTPVPTSVATAAPTATVTPTPEPTPSPTPSPTPKPKTAMVAVAGFRTDITETGPEQIGAILGGTEPTFKALELVEPDSNAVLAALSLTKPSDPTRLFLAPTADALAADLDKHPDRLGIVRAAQVGPSVHALAWQGKSLFGVGHVTSLADWPLGAELATSGGADAGATAAPGATNFDPATLWTVAAGGDVMLDRGVYKVLGIQKKGADYPWAGGIATITARRCCTTWDWVYPIAKRTSTEPMVKELISAADISMANLEGPAPNKATYHNDGFAFTFQQSFVAGLDRAGFDVLSMANNHIGNAGAQGIRETAAYLDKLGIAHTGAADTKVAAGKAAMFTVAGVKVAVLGVSQFGGLTAQLGNAPALIKAARSAGAKVVIVYPHWGTEYKTKPNQAQIVWGHKMIDAGADVVIGNHAHYVAGMEIYKGKPIWYALGNLVFDQDWSEQTEEGLILELTFSGTRLVQIRMHPILIMDNSQPNLLDTASGRPVLDQLYKGSGTLLPW